LGAVFCAVFSALGGFGAARVAVRDFFAAGAAFVRFIAGDADLACDAEVVRPLAVPRDDDVLRGEALRALDPLAGAARDEPLRVVAFFVDFLADFFAVFDAAAFARFDFA